MAWTGAARNGNVGSTTVSSTGRAGIDSRAVLRPFRRPATVTSA